MATRRDLRDLVELLDFQPLEPSEALRRRVLASIETPTRFEGFVARFAGLFDLPEARSREILAAGGAAGDAGSGWVAAPIPGVHFYHFAGGARVAAADCGLVLLAPGTQFPSHRHKGREWNLVLSGAAEESDGTLWQPGDLLIRETNSVHAFRALPGEPLLFAVVLENGIEVVAEPAAK